MNKNRYWTFAVALVALVLAGCPAPQTAEPPESGEETAAMGVMVMNLPLTTESEAAREAFMAGMRAIDVGRFPEARDYFADATAADPGFAMGHYGQALSAISVEEFAAHLKAAAEGSEGATESEKLLIASQQAQFDNDMEGALEAAGRLADLEQDSPRAVLRIAQVETAMGRYDDGRATAMKAAEMSPDFAPAYSQMGNSYLFNLPVDFAMAEENMKKVAELEPDEPQSFDFLGDVYRAQGKLEEAHAAYTRAAELDPDLGSPLQQRGHVNSFMGNFEEARADYTLSMELSTDDLKAGYAPFRAFVAVHEGDPERAVAELEQLVADIDGYDIPDPKGYKVGALFSAGMIAMHSGMNDEAADIVAQCGALMMEQADEVGSEQFRRGQETTVAMLDGMVAARAGNYDEATAKAEIILALMEPDTNPRKNEPAHRVLGLSSLLQENYAAAVEHYEQANLNDPYVRYNLALAQEGAGNAEAAQEIFAALAEYNFNSAGYALIRKDVLERAG